MIYSQRYTPVGLLDQEAVQETLVEGLAGKFTGQKVLALIPDHTRSLPLPQLFRMVVEILGDTRQLDFMVALGTHPPLTEDHLLQLVGISAEERQTKYRQIGLLNHAWNDPTMLVSLGVMDKDEIRQIARSSWHPTLPDEIEIRINKLALKYDQILIIGPTFPHEVVGFSGGAKYLFPGISGPDMINAPHWLGNQRHPGAYHDPCCSPTTANPDHAGSPLGGRSRPGRPGGGRPAGCLEPVCRSILPTPHPVGRKAFSTSPLVRPGHV
jgi:nickel-dependent lactate racemase